MEDRDRRLAATRMADGRIRDVLVLDDGRTLRLPIPVDNAELALPGNALEVQPGVVIACYDGQSRTGLLWSALPSPYWTLIQPCLREDFFSRIVPDFAEVVAKQDGAGKQVGMPD